MAKWGGGNNRSQDRAKRAGLETITFKAQPTCGSGHPHLSCPAHSRADTLSAAHTAKPLICMCLFARAVARQLEPAPSYGDLATSGLGTPGRPIGSGDSSPPPTATINALLQFFSVKGSRNRDRDHEICALCSSRTPTVEHPMDVVIPPELDRKTKEIASLLADLPDDNTRTYALADIAGQADLKVMLIRLPKSLSQAETEGLYHAFSTILDLSLRDGMGGVSIFANAHGSAFNGVSTPEGAPNLIKEDIDVLPHGGSFQATTRGPISVRLPHWMPEELVVDICGLMWRVLRFCVAGAPSEMVDPEVEHACRSMLAERGLERSYSNAVAVGYLRFILTQAGVPTVDIYGVPQEDLCFPVPYDLLFGEPDYSLPRIKAYREALRESGVESSHG